MIDGGKKALAQGGMGICLHPECPLLSKLYSSLKTLLKCYLALASFSFNQQVYLPLDSDAARSRVIGIYFLIF